MHDKRIITGYDKKKGKNGLNVLLLEPYYGGSHQSFISGLSKLPFHFELMTFPARKWKWRMRLAAPYYAHALHDLGRRFDRIICSSYVDVASFRGLAPPWVREVPLLTYFHENQFAYPQRAEHERDLHFALTNMTTALASDSVAFNSRYNLTTFLDGIGKFMKQSHDLKLKEPGRTILEKSRILSNGIDFTVIDDQAGEDRHDIPAVLWNHRWEHDKNPEMFFEALFTLESEGLDFSLIVLGESFRESPPVFSEVRERLSRRILHCGYAGSRDEYAGWLKRGDLVVSTSRHEFFGVSVIEAVRAGCRPLLPKRLSYPELFPEEFLYEDDFSARLREEIARNERLRPAEARTLTERFSWKTMAPEFTSWIENAQITTP